MKGVCIGCKHEQNLAGHVDSHGRWVCVVCGNENQVPAPESGSGVSRKSTLRGHL